MDAMVRLPDDIAFDKSEVHVLVVEDTFTQALVMQNLLSRDGYKVSIARSGAQALELLRAEGASIVLTDVSMPEMDGYQLCKSIKSDAKLQHIPVVMLASFAEQKDILKILDCGADNMLLKQFDEALLLSRLGSILKTCAMRKASPNAELLPIHFNSGTYGFKPNAAQVTDLLLSVFCVGVFLGHEKTEEEYAQVED